ncbi:sensor histidine kinase [Sphingomonas gilva]|uniref:histidine kinase n=2 Tax=Sphingomonas gilva TaxID=2305907 RepID=A0A396RNZ3_9SPHN|nr:sensor histidine kinase [Sphingomonas gilva]
MIILYLAARANSQVAADRSYDRLLAGAALSIAETLSIDAGEVRVDIPYAALDMLSAAPDDRVFYRVIGPAGNTVTGYSDLPRARTPRRGDRGVNPSQFFDARYRGELVRFVVLQREIAQSGATGWLAVQVGQTRRARDALARDLTLDAVAPIVLLTLLALASVWFGIGHALRPLTSIGEDLARREPSDLQPVAAAVPREVAPLVDSINGFMGRLGANIDSLRAFIAQAAHQMRTPLAALRAQAQVASEDDPDELRHALRAVERNASKLSRLLNQLLSDATVNHRSDMRDFAPCDLNQVIRNAIRESISLSEHSDAHFCTPLDVAPFVGDALLIGEALKNLIDNALLHGGANGRRVDIELAATDAIYVLTVSDRGPGIAIDDRERLFERFARGTGLVPGAGLGLAIVRQAIASHDGSVSLLDRPGGGLIVMLELPRRGK